MRLNYGMAARRFAIIHLVLTTLCIASITKPFRILLKYLGGPVAQWIEQLRPKEKVVRSTRIWATIYEVGSGLVLSVLARKCYNISICQN